MGTCALFVPTTLQISSTSETKLFQTPMKFRLIRWSLFNLLCRLYHYVQRTTGGWGSVTTVTNNDLNQIEERALLCGGCSESTKALINRKANYKNCSLHKTTTLAT